MFSARSVQRGYKEDDWIKDYDRKGSVGRKIAGRESQGAWRQDELIGGKPPVVKLVTLTLWIVQ
jgi:hypothetical protein